MPFTVEDFLDEDRSWEPKDFEESDARSAKREKLKAEMVEARKVPFSQRALAAALAIAEPVVDTISKMNPLTVIPRAAHGAGQVIGAIPADEPFPLEQDKPLVDLHQALVNPVVEAGSALDELRYGAQQAVADVGQFFVTPAGISTLGAGAAPKAAQAALAAGFAGSMAAHVPEAHEATKQAAESGSMADTARAVLNEVATIGAPLAIGAGALRQGLKPAESLIAERIPAEIPVAEKAPAPAATEVGAGGQPSPTQAIVPPRTAVFNGIQMAGPSFKYFNEKTGRWNDVSAETAAKRGIEIPPEELAKAEKALNPTVTVEQSADGINPLQVREQAAAQPADLPEVSRQVLQDLEKIPSAQRTAAQEKQLSEIRAGISPEGKAESGAVRQMPEPSVTDAPQRLQQAPSGDLAVQAVSPKAAQAAEVRLYAGIPDPVATARSVSELAKSAGELASPHLRRAGQYLADASREALTLPKTSDYRRSVLDWSSKLQRSFDEASQRQKSIMKAAPDEVTRQGITNWIQAGGDKNVLAERFGSTTDLKLKAGYQSALSLTPEQQALAGEIKATFDSLAERGKGSGVLDNFKDNYVTQIWDLDKGPSVGSSRNLKKNFRYAKARVFNSYFEGEQAGYSPKTKDIAKILPLYLHEMNSVIAARELAADIGKGKASDGKPLSIPRGVLSPQTSEYKMLPNQPAFNNLALHPEAFNRIKAVVGKSAIREWYNTPTGALPAIPKAIIKGLDLAQSETKKTMLGFFAPFHQVQEGTHAIGHRISPFNSPKIDLVNNGHQVDATRHGLMLAPDRASESHFMEGFKTSGLISKIPGIGPLADSYSTYLFHQYIPGLKFKTYEAILERNNEVYAKELQNRSVAPEDVKILSAEQANAAYGHLNYADLGRNPTVQHMLQLGLLAPDFLEARGRFALQAAKGATGAKVGREQLVALGFLAASQAIAAYTGAQLAGGEWDARHPFEFIAGSRRYTMRSVPEDIDALITHTRSFVHGRLSPVIGKGTVQSLSGVNWRGQKVTPLETAKEIAAQPIPLTLRSVPGLDKLTGTDRPGAIKPLEQLAGALGLKISRHNPQSKLNELHGEWLENNPDPKIKKAYEEQQKQTFAISKYKQLDSALADRDENAIKQAYQKLFEEGVKRSDIYKRFNPYTASGEAQKPLFQESSVMESKFKKSFTPEQLELYNQAKQDRKDQWKLFLKVYRENK